MLNCAPQGPGFCGVPCHAVGKSALRPAAPTLVKATPLPSIGKINNLARGGNFRLPGGRGLLSFQNAKGIHDFPGPEPTPLYQAAILATAGALPLPGGLPLGQVGECPPHGPKGLTALCVFGSRVIPINPAGCGVKKCRPALRAGSP